MSQLKQFRHLAMRYDKTASGYLRFVQSSTWPTL